MSLWAQKPSAISSQHLKRLETVLQQSRLASIAKPTSRGGSQKSASNRSKQHRLHPTQQVITTTPASNFRNNWGLKNDLPKKKRSPYITLNSIDVNGLVDYDPGAGYTMTSRRIQELKTSIQPLIPIPSKNYLSDFFYSPKPAAQHSLDNSPEQSQDRETEKKRASFLHYLENTGYPRAKINQITKDGPLLERTLSKYRTKGNSLTHQANLFADPQTSSNPPPSLMRPIGTAGLLYSLKGSLHNRPLRSSSAKAIGSTQDQISILNSQLSPGSLESEIFPGRFVDSSGSRALVAGIVGTTNAVDLKMNIGSSNSNMQAQCQPLSIRTLQMKGNGSVEMVLNANRFDNSSQANNNASLTAQLKLGLNNSIQLRRAMDRGGGSSESEFMSAILTGHD